MPSGHGTRGRAPLEPRHRWVQSESILKISRIVADAARSETFYCNALGFRTVSRSALDPGVETALGLTGRHALEVSLRLGADELALVQLDAPGRPYPADSRSDDLWFQHLAIVVGDMDAAHAHLRAQGAYRPISADGPQDLPPNAGGVRAFKFRDPDGHPLELLWLPPGAGRSIWHRRRAAEGGAGPFLGIDHSGVAVSSTRRSLAFYRALGLHVTSRSLQSGTAQSRLDGLGAAQVRVTGLRPASADGPGIELLAYRPPGRALENPAIADLATDWITIEALTAGDGGGSLSRTRALTDPDGHRYVLLGQRGASRGLPA